MLFWDVNNGVARRGWAGNDNADFAVRREMDRTPGLRVTLAECADDALLESL
jgi:urocanate hydratase